MSSGHQSLNSNILFTDFATSVGNVQDAEQP